MISKQLFRISLILVTLLGMVLLPRSIESWPVTVILMLVFIISLIWGRIKNYWLPTLLIGTFLGITDLFGLVRDLPEALFLVILTLWIGGIWLIGHVGHSQKQVFHQALSSFLVVEVFLTLHLWPINILSKSVVIIAFAFFLWHEFVRDVSPKQRLYESVIPFILIVILMTLTGQWMTF